MEVLREKLDLMANWVKELVETLGYSSRPVSKIDKATQIRLKLVEKLERDGKRTVY